jgi:hypothetical protein
MRGGGFEELDILKKISRVDSKTREAMCKIFLRKERLRYEVNYMKW